MKDLFIYKRNDHIPRVLITMCVILGLIFSLVTLNHKDKIENSENEYKDFVEKVKTAQFIDSMNMVGVVMGVKDGIDFPDSVE